MGGRTRTSSVIPVEKRNKMGRPPGSLNKTTVDTKAAILMAFDKIGGVDKLAAWALEKQTAMIKDMNDKGETVWRKEERQPNLETFYTQVLTRVLPLNMNVAAAVDHTVSVTDDGRETIQSALAREIAANRTASERNLQIIDAEPVREPVPQMVILGEARSKTA